MPQISTTDNPVEAIHHMEGNDRCETGQHVADVAMQSWKTAFSAYFQTEKSRPRALHVAARRSQLKRTTNQRRRSASPAPLSPPSSRAVIAAPSPNVSIGTRHPSPNSNTYTEPQTNPSSRSRETAADRNVSNNSKTSSRKDISFPGGFQTIVHFIVLPTSLKVEGKQCRRLRLCTSTPPDITALLERSSSRGRYSCRVFDSEPRGPETSFTASGGTTSAFGGGTLGGGHLQAAR
ncbi:hypothetical protein Bbelb_354920 [Branchiostoma belcheri]|nr:hypothetical protein Bbelb_354920 [Branchiostoma belcheri]